VWWPNKDIYSDEPDSQRVTITVPDPLIDVSNGRLRSTTPNADGSTTYEWFVRNPINNYDVAVNAAHYAHFNDVYQGEKGELTLDFYPLDYHLDTAKKQFQQVKPMLQCFESWFGPFPWYEDGYKLVETPHLGMEHQSAVAYGNHYLNGYLGRDRSKTGHGLLWDFIIIHESAHEWFGNSITAADRSDMWIHEGWATYLEALYVEYRWGHPAAIEYLNGLKPKVKNQQPILCPRGINATPPDDQYFKGALMLNTLRSVVDNDQRWFAIIHGFYQRFKYKNILTQQVVAYFNQATGLDLTPVFNQYLRHAEIPTLELKFAPGTVAYRWKAGEPDFAMPVRVGRKGDWTIVRPLATRWQSMKTPLAKQNFEVETDLYYIKIDKS
jgi:aminopeptidase N